VGGCGNRTILEVRKVMKFERLGRPDILGGLLRSNIFERSDRSANL
jgi:hypothetical protein